MEEEIISQMGLLLTQVRFSRRALEDLERNTATYGGFSFLQNLASGSAFGEPPLIDGALKVYVVNINDLVIDRSAGGLIEGILGGIGRFFGGLVGGFTGGTISGVALPIMLAQVNAIADKIRDILNRMGAHAETPNERMFNRRLGILERVMDFLQGRPATPPPATTAEQNASGGGLAQILPVLTDAMLGLTALFRAAAGDTGPGSSGPTARQAAAQNQILRFLQPVYAILRGLSRVIDGLIILVPILTGAFAMFLVRLNDIKLAFIEMLQFVMRNVFLLRGVVLVTLFDTISIAARLGANILRILSDAVVAILNAVFNVIAQVVQTALAGLKFILDGFRNSINPLLNWLLRTVHAALAILGDSALFRVFYHIVSILPHILPALVRLVHGTGLTAAELRLVQRAARTSIPPPSRSGVVPTLPPFPNLSATLMPPTEMGRLMSDVRLLGRGVRNNVRNVFRASERALLRTGRALDETNFQTGLTRRIRQLTTRADQLANAISSAQRAAARRPRTGLEEIAQAYETWLNSGGLRGLMQRITDHFRQSPTQGGRTQRGLLTDIVTETALTRSRATVEIDEVVVEIAPPANPTNPGPTGALLPKGIDFERFTEMYAEYRERSGDDLSLDIGLT